MSKATKKQFNDRKKDSKKGFYVGGVLNILETLYYNENFKRPRKKKELPVFTEDEIELLVKYLFFKPKNWRMAKIRKS